jgi:hypothetical protein
MNPEVPSLSPDFAERVLRQVARVRRRRTLTWAGVAVVGIAAAVLGVGRLSRPPLASEQLVAADFEWLEEVGTGTSTPASVVFPDDRTPEENLLVAVAQNY